MKKFIAILVSFVLLCGCAFAETGIFAQGGSGAQLNDEYYMQVSEGETDALVRIARDGYAYVALRAEEFGGMVVSEAALYYLMRTEGTWVLMSSAGGRTETVYTFAEGVEVSDIGARDGLIFVLVDGRLHILYPQYAMCIQLSGVLMESYVIEDDYAYYISADDRVSYMLSDGAGNIAETDAGKLCRVNMSTGRYEVLLEDGAEGLQYTEGNLYFHYFADRYLTGTGDDMTIDGRLYSYDITGGKVEKQTDMYDWEFFADENGVYVLRREAIVALSGSMETIVCAVPQVVEVVEAGDSFVVFDARNMTFGVIAK